MQPINFNWSSRSDDHREARERSMDATRFGAIPRTSNGDRRARSNLGRRGLTRSDNEGRSRHSSHSSRRGRSLGDQGVFSRTSQCETISADRLRTRRPVERCSTDSNQVPQIISSNMINHMSPSWQTFSSPLSYGTPLYSTSRMTSAGGSNSTSTGGGPYQTSDSYYLNCPCNEPAISTRRNNGTRDVVSQVSSTSLEYGSAYSRHSSFSSNFRGSSNSTGYGDSAWYGSSPFGGYGSTSSTRYDSAGAAGYAWSLSENRGSLNPTGYDSASAWNGMSLPPQDFSSFNSANHAYFQSAPIRTHYGNWSYTTDHSYRNPVDSNVYRNSNYLGDNFNGTYNESFHSQGSLSHVNDNFYTLQNLGASNYGYDGSSSREYLDATSQGHNGFPSTRGSSNWSQELGPFDQGHSLTLDSGGLSASNATSTPNPASSTASGASFSNRPGLDRPAPVADHYTDDRDESDDEICYYERFNVNLIDNDYGSIGGAIEYIRVVHVRDCPNQPKPNADKRTHG